IARQAAALRRALEAPEASLAARGRIDANGQWTHPLTLSTFAVGDVDGHNDSLDVECHRNKSALPFDADAEFTIPPAWGYCVLRVHGQPGTTFTLYEFGEPLGRGNASNSSDRALSAAPGRPRVARRARHQRPVAP